MNIYAQRRRRLLNSIGTNRILVLFSSDSISGPEKFNVNRNFYYLTGIDKESMALVLENKNGFYKEAIFTLPYDEELAKWVGGRMLAEEVMEKADIASVLDYADLDDYVEDSLESLRAYETTLLLDLWKGNSIASIFAKKMLKKFPNVEVRDTFPYITPLRLIKDDYEVSCIKNAIEITRVGIEAMMKTIKPGIGEMEMDGLFTYALAKNNCNEMSFKTIAASGRRATILHYSDNNQVIEDGDLFLQDLGATYNHYCADITRTYPANGKFSDRQKEVYSLVLRAQKLVQANAKPGVSLRELNNMVVDFYRAELPSIGLNEDVREYYYHSVSHQIGLDCHDANGDLGLILKPGMVISNEPGLYIEEENIGIRIEDDLLISENGCENLSSSIIKEIDDIEKFMEK